MINLRPSNANRWINCPGSIRLERDYGQSYPFADEKDRERGILMHKDAEKRLHNIRDPKHSYTMYEDSKLSQSDQDYVEIAVAWVNEITQDCSVTFTEKKLKSTGDNWELTGTADALSFDSATGIMHIFDYKFGFNAVKPDCLQLKAYALMSLDLGYPVQKISVHIVQPTKYKEIKTHSYSPDSLDSMHDHIDIISESYRTKAGAWCKFCTFANQCRELKNEILKKGKVIPRYGDSHIEVTPSGDTNESAANDLTEIYELEKLVVARKISLEAHLTASLIRGEYVQGFVMKSTGGSLSWTEKPATIIREAEIRGLAVEKPAAVITPTQTLAKYKKIEGGLTFVTQFSEKKAGFQKLTRATKKDILNEFEGGVYG